MKRVARKIIEKYVKAKFITTWTSIIIIEMGDCFHHDFQVSL
jgi:hypothetical protein